MGFFKNLFSINQDVSLIKSQYSDMPRFYNIDGIEYDIDNPDDIDKIPLTKKKYYINDVLYGMDTILFEHGKSAYEENLKVHQSAISKANEFRYNGIIFKSKKEKAAENIKEKYLEQQENEKSEREKQCNSFSIKDMYQFVDIPFEWRFVQELKHTNGISWFMLNKNNQYIALKYIDFIDKIIISLHDECKKIKKCEIFVEEIDFDYPLHATINSFPNTYVECLPYTKTWKISKYPVIIHFSTSEIIREKNYVVQIHPIMGEIKILKDGNIGCATVHFGHIVFRIGLNGITLIVKRIDDEWGNIYKFE